MVSAARRGLAMSVARANLPTHPVNRLATGRSGATTKSSKGRATSAAVTTRKALAANPQAAEPVSAIATAQAVPTTPTPRTIHVTASVVPRCSVPELRRVSATDTRAARQAGRTAEMKAVPIPRLAASAADEG